MNINPNFSNQNISEAQPPRGRLPVAILLGLLTFVVTPLVAVPFLLLGKISGSFNPMVIVVSVFRLRDLGGFFEAQFILMAFFALLGDLGTAIISWFVHRSGRLAAVTFASAIAFQVISVAVVLPATLGRLQEKMNAGIAREKSYEEYATIGEVSIDPQGPFKFPYALHGKLTEALLFKKLVFNIPVDVLQPGAYEVNVQYASNSTLYANSDSLPSTKQILDVGHHVIQVEFVAGAAPNLGYESPSSVQGRALVQLDYLASKKELLDFLKSNSTADQKVLRQFMKDEGLNRGADSTSTVRKFVGRKEVQF